MIFVLFIIIDIILCWLIMHYSTVKENPKSHKKKIKKSFGGLKKRL
jgi:hypothetical protein